MYNAAALEGGWDVSQELGGPNGVASINPGRMQELKEDMMARGVPENIFNQAIQDAYLIDTFIAQGLGGSARAVIPSHGYAEPVNTAYKKLVKRVQTFIRLGGPTARQMRGVKNARKEARRKASLRLMDPTTKWWGSQQFTPDGFLVPSYSLLSNNWAGVDRPKRPKTAKKPKYTQIIHDAPWGQPTPQPQA